MPADYFTHELYALSDSALDSYFERNGNIVEVKDPDNPEFLNMPETFVERVRAILAARTGTKVVAAEDLTARLLNVKSSLKPRRFSLSSSTPETSTPPRASSHDTIIVDQSTRHAREVEGERRAHNALVEDGAVPSHPIEFLEKLSQVPPKYSEILSYWQGDWGPTHWTVFRKQMWRWKNFRSFQSFVRDKDAGPDLTVDFQDMILTWKDIFVECAPRQPRPFPRKENRFQVYISWVKERLENHHVGKPLLALQEDHTSQDQATTMSEYLAYECWWHDWHIMAIQREKKAHDAAWATLVESDDVSSLTSEEEVFSLESSKQRTKDLEESQSNLTVCQVKLDEATAALARGSQKGPALQSLKRNIKKLTSDVKAAKFEHEIADARIKRIRTFLSNYDEYRRSRVIAERQLIIIHWAEKQVNRLQQGDLPESRPESVSNDSRKRLSPTREVDSASKRSGTHQTKKARKDDGQLSSTRVTKFSSKDNEADDGPFSVEDQVSPEATLTSTKTKRGRHRQTVKEPIGTSRARHHAADDLPAKDSSSKHAEKSQAVSAITKKSGPSKRGTRGADAIGMTHESKASKTRKKTKVPSTSKAETSKRKTSTMPGKLESPNVRRSARIAALQR